MVTAVKCTTVGVESVYEYIGKSTDTKPDSTNGSKFIEMDTGKEFIFDGDEKGWFEQADKYLDFIEIKTAPAKTTYYVGDKFDPSGVAINATYTDASVQTVTNFEVDAPEKLNMDSIVAIKYTENGRTRKADVEVTIKSNVAEDTASFVDIVKNGSEVVLANDIFVDSMLSFDKDFILDLNGHSLESSTNIDYLLSAIGSTLTIRNGEVSARRRIGHVANGGQLIIESGEFTSDTDVAFDAIGAGSRIVFNDGKINAVEGGLLALDGAEVEVNGGKIYVSDNFPLGTNGTDGRGGNTITINGGYFEGNIKSVGYEAIGFYIANNDIVTINGGEFKANNGCGILMRGGTVVINNVKIKATGVEGGGGWVGDRKTKMSQSAIIFDEKSNYPGHNGMSLTINGGVFVGFDHSLEVLPGATEPNVIINGGAFIPVVA